MANLNPPPQAYTRETLTQAFEWLHQQDPHIRETASSMDAMVAMYLQAKRRGQLSTGGDLASAQNFKKDLKHLAEDLKKFEAPGIQAQMSPQHAPNYHAQFAQPQAAQTQVAQPQAPAYQAPIYQAPVAQVASGAFNLDSKTIDTLEAVRDAFNLSSDAEALRLLVSVGFEHIRQILPKT